MKHIHIDMLGGIAGDMFLAAAIDADLVDTAALESALSSLGVGDIRIVTERVRRGAISGTHVHFEGWDPAEERDHRHLSTILEMLDTSGLDAAVKARAKEMFQTLGESESKVHDIPLETVHFHECGALDSIFDFVSAAFIIETTGASWSASAVPTGSGTVETDHGTVPVPVPATADILKGFELIARPVQAELVTPTGATILKTLRGMNPGFDRPQATVSTVGYGCGTRELAEFSNVVRFLVLETEATGDEADETRDVVAKLTCEIDDMQPELFPSVEAKLFDEGALDVVREPVYMKKGRQGIRLSVLCRPADRDRLADVLFRETTTFGVRVEQVERLKLARKILEVETSAGTVHVKVGYKDGKVLKATPEYEDCLRLAAETGTPVREIYIDALTAAASH
ncbi:nickel pincer cofactor biosynthesis protein LarC [Persicimonas caeni]|uniref:Putative nickel insertion protein n=1 Tax=Persicimonas caeni TaxID=2292766 RepID=A0A4Y6PSJ8_PERCE|nr:nickel pincer cofactor biosynthesis protein LarC [Persicimonas caeni]QDG51278.1 nickel pincer cofactor biosynthesis protein LarC [Persicimonas caeni]QED32499.1 nickel pincer cofactor biosynthesis protein LarC [Persicimonas caeni]